jgi:hypothetical protein
MLYANEGVELGEKTQQAGKQSKGPFMLGGMFHWCDGGKTPEA